MFILVGLMEFVLLKRAPTSPKKVCRQYVCWLQYENILEEPQQSWMFMVHLWINHSPIQIEKMSKYFTFFFINFFFYQTSVAVVTKHMTMPNYPLPSPAYFHHMPIPHGKFVHCFGNNMEQPHNGLTTVTTTKLSVVYR